MPRRLRREYAFRAVVQLDISARLHPRQNGSVDSIPAVKVDAPCKKSEADPFSSTGAAKGNVPLLAVAVNLEQAQNLTRHEATRQLMQQAALGCIGHDLVI